MHHEIVHVTSRQTPSSGWSPGRYLLAQEFCPIQDIHLEVERLRQKARLPWLLLVPYGVSGAVRNLTVVATGSSVKAQRVRDVKRTVDLQLDREDFLDLAARLVAALSESEDTPVRLLAGPHQGLDDGSVGYWLCGPNLASSAIDDDSRVRLAEMLAGTAVVNSLRDGRIQRLIAEATSGSDPMSWADGLRRLLELAKRVAGANGAAFYAFQPKKHRLKMECQVGEPPPLPKTVRASAELGTTAAAVFWAFRRSRTFLFPPPGHHQDRSDQLVCVPAPLATFGGLGRNAGVLVVWKSDGTPISWFDTALIRNVALRIALLRSNHSIESSAAELVAVAGQLASPSRSNSAGAAQRSGAVPADVELAKKELEQLASHLYSATSCNSVTIRVLMPATGQDAVSLRRFIAFPTERLSEDHDELVIPSPSRYAKYDRIHFRSANVRAAVVGLTHVRDSTNSLSEVPRLRGITSVGGKIPRSEIALPIRADGMLVGTLNLESDYPHAFDAQVGLIQAFAEMAGITIAIKRRESLRLIADKYSIDNDGVHLASKIERILASIDVQDATRGILSQIVGEVAPRTRVRDYVRDELPLIELIESVVGEVPGQKLQIERVERGPSLRPEHQVPIRAALREVLANLRRHSATTELPSLAMFPIKLTGHEYYALVFLSRPMIAMTNDRSLRSHYRVPIPHREQTDHFHLGCFTAGEMVRGIGGNLFAEISRDGRFETRMYIPARWHA